jgi:chromosome segregation ATPase
MLISISSTSGYDSQVNNLRNRECELQNKLNDLRAQIKTLEASIPSLDQERLSFEQTRQSVSTLEIRCSQLREDSHTILDELLQAQVVLSSIQMKTEQIAIELSECGYCNTRREIAGRLRDIVEGIQNAGKSRTIGYERNEVADALRKLNKIERRTNTVLMIMER